MRKKHSRFSNNHNLYLSMTCHFVDGNIKKSLWIANTFHFYQKCFVFFFFFFWDKLPLLSKNLICIFYFFLDKLPLLSKNLICIFYFYNCLYVKDNENTYCFRKENQIYILCCTSFCSKICSFESKWHVSLHLMASDYQSLFLILCKL